MAKPVEPKGKPEPVEEPIEEPTVEAPEEEKEDDPVAKKMEENRVAEAAEARAFIERRDAQYGRMASKNGRRPGSIVGDEVDVVKKAALTRPENTRFNEETGEFEGGEAPGEGTVVNDPKVREATEREKEDG